MCQAWISEDIFLSHVCFPRSHRHWQISNIYTTSYSLQLPDSKSTLIARVDSSDFVLAVWHAARWLFFCTHTDMLIPSRHSYAAGACLITAVNAFLAVAQVLSITVQRSWVRSLLIRVCIQGNGKELPGSMSLLNPIIGEVRSDSVCKMSTFSTSHLLSEGKHGQKS